MKLLAFLSRLSSSSRHYLLPDELDPQQAIFRALCRVGAVLTIVISVPVNLMQGLPLIISVAAFAFGVLALWLDRAAQRGKSYPSVLVAAAVLTVNFSWFPNAGSHGSILLIAFPVMLLPIVFFHGRARWISTSLIVVNFLGLLAVETWFPSLVTPFNSDLERMIDLLIGTVVSGATLVLVVGIVLSWHQRERQQLRVSVAALKASESRLSSVFQLNPDAVSIVDPETWRIIEANSVFERLSGWTRAETIGRTIDELDLLSDPEQRERIYQQLRTEGRIESRTMQYRRRDGVRRFSSLSAGFVDFADRKVLLVTARDITEEREASRVAAESRALIESLVNSAGEMVWLADPVTHKIVLFNEAFRHYFRTSRDQELRPGIGPDDTLPPEVAARWHEFYKRALAQGPFSLEYTTVRQRILSLSFTVVRHEERVLGVSVFGKDITAERRADEQRAKIELELMQAQKMESLGSLAGGVAHDFNNMLDGIMGYADLMLDEESDPLRKSRLHSILRAATRSSELTRKLLAFARRGKNIVEAVDVNALVADGLCMLRPSIQQDVRVITNLGQTWTIDGDPSQISQVVMNLCINAAEAMAKGGEFQVATTNRTLDRAWAEAHGRPAGDYVELRVSDTGVGMAKEVRARIFEPFFTTKADGLLSGTGLGLATVYGVVQLHHGAIEVTSTPGEGTTFTVWLPRGVLASGAPLATTTMIAGQGLVLIVEDEDLLRDLHSEMLEKIGYRSVTAGDGAEAVELFRKHHAELTAVLLDLKMPTMGGREAFLAMRAINDRVPVLICSGFGDNEEAQGLITLGARGLLGKPFRLVDLADRIQEMRA